jgi:hypothetical protein
MSLSGGFAVNAARAPRSTVTTPSLAVPELSAAGVRLSFPNEESRKKSARLP